MFTTLVESRGARERRAGGTALSVALHTTVVSLAIYATATAGPREHPNTREILHYVPQPSATHPPAPPVTRITVRDVPRIVVPGLDALEKVPTLILNYRVVCDWWFVVCERISGLLPAAHHRHSGLFANHKPQTTNR